MSGRLSPYVAAPSTVPWPGPPSRYSVTRSTPVPLVALRSIAQPTNDTGDRGSITAPSDGTSMLPVGSFGKAAAPGARYVAMLDPASNVKRSPPADTRRLSPSYVFGLSPARRLPSASTA